MIAAVFPFKSKEDAKTLAEDTYGSMMWDNSEDGKLKAYPFDSENPVVMDWDK